MNQISSYEALRTGAALLDLTGRGLIRVSDEDRTRLLHAMSTNAISTLKTGEGTQALFLNDKGRILAEFAAYCRKDDFLLDTEADTRQLVLEHLDHFIIMDVVELEDLSDFYCILGVEGPKAADALRALGATIPEAPFAHVSWDGAMLAKCSYTGAEGYRLYAPKEQREAWLQRLASAGISMSDTATAEIARLEWGKPRHGVEYTAQHLVQETQLLDHVSFSKGCYLGQEIVERVRSRGLVNRLLVRLVADLQEPPARDTPVMAGDASSGKVMNAGYSPTLGKCVVWALLRREHVQSGQSFTIHEASATLAPSGLLTA